MCFKNLCGQKKNLATIYFNNNRALIGLERKVLKNTVVNIDAGILCNEIINGKRSNFIHRLFNQNRPMPTHSFGAKDDCYQAFLNGYLLNVVGLRMSLGYKIESKKMGTNAKFYTYSVNIGFFGSKYNATTKLPNGNLCFKSANYNGLYPTVNGMYFFNLSTNSRYKMGIGINLAFYMPLWNSIEVSEIVEPVFGLEPEIKICFYKTNSKIKKG